MAEQVISKPPKNGSKKAFKLFIFILLMVLIVSFSCWYFGAHARGLFSRQEVKEVSKPVFYKLDPFTINLNGDSHGQMLYIVLTLRLKTSENVDILKSYLPEIRNRIILLLAQQSGTNLAQPEGKMHLAQLLRQSINQPVNAQLSVGVQDVLFSDFIVQ